MEDLVGRKNELQKQGKKKQGKVPGIVLKGLILAVAVGVVPLLHKQSPQLKGLVMGYASHAAIARSWELINLLFIALAISCGFISRSRHTDNANANANATDDAREQGAQNYVQKIFDFAEVFDNLDKAEAWSSRWQPQEPVVVIARDGSGTDHDKEKPLLLPIRSLKSSLSNAELLHFLKGADADAAVQESGKVTEVRNGTILSVESGNFEEEVSTVVADEEEPAVFPSPIPWALRLDKEAHPLVPAVVNLASDDGKIDLPAIPSPIPWRSRPDRSVLSDHDGKQKLGTENGDVSDSKPPLPPPQRPPPPPPEMPKKSASPSPSLGSANGNSQKNIQVPSGIPLQKFPSPSPSPSPPRPPPSVELTNGISEKNLQASSGTPSLHKLPSHAAFVENGSSQKNPNPKPQYSNAAAQAEEKDPTASAPSFPTVAENGSSVKHHSNGNFSIPKSPQSAVAPVPPPALQAKESSGNAPAYATNSRSKSGDDGSYLRGKGRECSSRSRRWSKIRESSAETSAEEGARARRSRKLELASPLSDVPLTPSSSPLDPDDSPPLPLPPPPPYFDDELSHETTSSSSDLSYQMDDSFSDTETEGEVDKKADQFIAKFHEQIRMQRVESKRRSQEER